MARFQLPYQHILKWRDATLNFRVFGQGKPIILLHGALTNWTGIEFAQNLAKNYKVYIPDLPGYGASDSIPKTKHNLNLMVHYFGFFLTQLGLRKAPIIALSLGAVIAIKTAAAKLSLGDLILIGLPGKIDSQNWLTKITPKFLQKIIISTSLGQRFLLLPMTQKNTGKAKKEPDNLMLKAISHTNPAVILDIDYEQGINNVLADDLAKVTNKMFFIYGEEDPLQNSTKHLIKNYLTIPNASHNIFTTNPKQSLKIILSLLKH
jgi:pimeloyl-ACP methyl ester carboxylesterase